MYNNCNIINAYGKHEFTFILLHPMHCNSDYFNSLIVNFENHIDPNDPANNCLDVAIITAPEKRTKKTIEKLNTVAGRVLNK